MKWVLLRALGLWRHSEYRVGLADMAPLSIGLSAWGVMTGVAMVKSGIGLPAAILMGIVVFAGSSQLAALPLIASGAPMGVVLATAFCVNLRFVVFSLHLRPYVMHQSFWRRMLSGYLTADLSYVLLTRRYPRPPTVPAEIAALEAYWTGCGSAGWCSWTASSLVGVALGSRVPVSWGLGFAAILALLAVTSSLVSTRLRGVSVTVAASAAVAAYALPLKLNILVAVAAAVSICMLLETGTARRRRPGSA